MGGDRSRGLERRTRAMEGETQRKKAIRGDSLRRIKVTVRTDSVRDRGGQTETSGTLSDSCHLCMKLNVFMRILKFDQNLVNKPK